MLISSSLQAETALQVGGAALADVLMLGVGDHTRLDWRVEHEGQRRNVAVHELSWVRCARGATSCLWGEIIAVPTFIRTPSLAAGVGIMVSNPRHAKIDPPFGG